MNEIINISSSVAALPLGELLKIHKMEATEGFTVITVYSVVVFGLLGFIGSPRRIHIPVRIAMSIAFILFSIMSLAALVGTLELHSAIHLEISERIMSQPSLVTTEALRSQLSSLSRQPIGIVTGANIIFNLLVVLGILSIGDGGLIEKYRKENKTTKG